MIGGQNLGEMDSLDIQSGHLAREVRRGSLQGDGLMDLRKNRVRVEIAALKECFADTHGLAEAESGYDIPD